MLNRCWYQNSFNGFRSEHHDKVLGTIERSKTGSSEEYQDNAWASEIEILHDVLSKLPFKDGEIIFEYSIPRLGKRIDVVLLVRGLIFVLEFKVGQSEYLPADMEQAMDYALDLKNFHLASHDRYIVPILIATEASKSSFDVEDIYEDHIYNVACANYKSLVKVISSYLSQKHDDDIDPIDWVNSRYMPTPTIIEAAKVLYHEHSVDDITKTEASGASLRRTTDCVIDIINKTKANKEKAICFVTGVPGAGKTLVGLNVAIQQSDVDDKDKRNLAVYLSGNGPLVKVLVEALARDKQARDKAKGIKTNKSDAEREVKEFIQNIHNYRDNMLAKIETPIKNGKLQIDSKKSKAIDDGTGHSEVEHVAIFDEAQRSWTQEKISIWLKRGGSYVNKIRVADFPMSEAEFLIWSLNLREDWAVVVCLVGGGQEIGGGEAGIAEWIKAIVNMFPDWRVYISDQLKDKEYAEGDVDKYLKRLKHVSKMDSLHLNVSMRSFRAENLSNFVHSLLDCDAAKAKAFFNKFSKNYPIVLTRNVETAKKWLKERARGSERYGIVASSKALRLRPLAVDVRQKADIVHWFQDDRTDVRSSLYQLNAYRVLLTRARQGMIICVPEGSADDPTRLPEFYDSTFRYLKSLGLELI